MRISKIKFPQKKNILLGKIFERSQDQLDTKIEIIIGNPPYSVGQKSANDNNQNNFYENLEKRIAETYAKNTPAKVLL